MAKVRTHRLRCVDRLPLAAVVQPWQHENHHAYGTQIADDDSPGQRCQRRRAPSFVRQVRNGSSQASQETVEQAWRYCVDTLCVADPEAVDATAELQSHAPPMRARAPRVLGRK